MTYRVTQKEIESIARISQLELTDVEIDDLTPQIEQFLAYTRRNSLMTPPEGYHLHKNVNVFRLDEPQACDAEPILQRAPQREGSFFVVPVIIGS